jgi:hypothetical protein
MVPTQEVRQLLLEARSAIQVEDWAAGRQLLEQVITLDSANEIGWMWLSAIAPDPEYERICLHRVLTINPQNELAIKALKNLEEGRTTDPQGSSTTAASTSPGSASDAGDAAGNPALQTPNYSMPRISLPIPIRYCPNCGAADSHGAPVCISCDLPLADPKKVCLRCGRERNLWDTLGLTSQLRTRRCNQCETEVGEAKRAFQERYRRVLQHGVISQGTWAEMEAFCLQARMSLAEGLRHVGVRSVFSALTANGDLTDSEWAYLKTFCAKAEVALGNVLTSVRDVSIRLVDRRVASLMASEIITSAQEQAIYQLADRLQIPVHDISRVRLKIGRARQLADILRGEIGTVDTRAMLKAGEQCHWDAPARYVRQLKRGPTAYEGQLIITNQRLIFVAPRGGFEFPIQRIIQISELGNGVHLQLSRQSGTGHYYLRQSDIVATILRTLVRVHNRRFTTKEHVRTRHIPDEVRAAVWRRDGGRCVRCGATDDLEFDHIIPFSKGGANTVSNIQLLCRRCNRAKRDSI